MRLTTFALWSTALVISASVTAGTSATGEEPRLPDFYEAHEIGYIDLNSPQELGGWLSTIPASSPMWSTVQRNDGRRTADAPATRANPLGGRETAPQSGPDVFRPDPAPQPGMPSTQPSTQPSQTPGNPGRVNGNDSGGLNTRPNRPAPPVESTPVPPTTTTTVAGDPPPRTRVDGETVRFPARRWTGLGGCDPLIHFYADSAVQVNVKAGFKDGVPVAWWPRGLANGEQVEFRDVRVDPNLDPVSSQSINLQKWPGLKPLGLLRDAMATPVKLGNKVEGGIAYEGLMKIAPDLTVRMAVKGIYEVRNDSEMELVDAVLIPFGETEQGIALGTVKPGDVVYVDLKDAKPQSLTGLLAKQLAKSGLFPAEIDAMQRLILSPEFRLNTGARLLARFSDAEWAKRFPLEIAPAPKRLVRVGMLRIFDAQLYNASGDRDGNGRPAPKTQLTGQKR